MEEITTTERALMTGEGPDDGEGPTMSVNITLRVSGPSSVPREDTYLFPFVRRSEISRIHRTIRDLGDRFHPYH